MKKILKLLTNNEEEAKPTTRDEIIIKIMTESIRKHPNNWILTYYARNCYHVYDNTLDIPISIFRKVGHFSKELGVLVHLGVDDMKEILENDDVGVFYIVSINDEEIECDNCIADELFCEITDKIGGEQSSR